MAMVNLAEDVNQLKSFPDEFKVPATDFDKLGRVSRWAVVRAREY
jgi:hypothetical protein